MIEEDKELWHLDKGLKQGGVPSTGLNGIMGSIWYHGDTICVNQGLTLSTATLFYINVSSPLHSETGSGERRAWLTWRGRSGRRWRGLSRVCKTASGISCSWTQKWPTNLQKSPESLHPPARKNKNYIKTYFIVKSFSVRFMRFYSPEVFPPQTIWNYLPLALSSCADVNPEVGQNIIFPFGSNYFFYISSGIPHYHCWHSLPLHYLVFNIHHHYC